MEELTNTIIEHVWFAWDKKQLKGNKESQGIQFRFQQNFFSSFDLNDDWLYFVTGLSISQ